MERVYGEYIVIKDLANSNEIAAAASTLVDRMLCRIQADQAKSGNLLWIAETQIFPKIFFSEEFPNQLHSNMIMVEDPSESGFQDKDGKFIRYADVLKESYGSNI